MVLLEEVRKLILSRGSEGVLQCELWKELGVNSREGSRLSKRLEKENLIRRKRILYNSRWTYKLCPILDEEHQPVEWGPCVECNNLEVCGTGGDTNPYNCDTLTHWIEKLVNQNQKKNNS